MVFFNYALRKLNAKIVYYGPGLCGKTTNLQWIHDHFEGGQRGKMISLSTEGDRTIFFDLLPLDIGSIRGMDVTLQLYTVPGQVHYNSTRQLVLRGADGVVFVADSQATMRSSNIESLRNLEENLSLQGVEIESFPHVLQFNKRDLADLITIEDLDRDINPHSAPFFEAVATEGVGVQETLEGIVKLVMRSLRERYEPVVAAGPRPIGVGVPINMEVPPPPEPYAPAPPVAPERPIAPPYEPPAMAEIPDEPAGLQDDVPTGVYPAGRPLTEDEDDRDVPGAAFWDAAGEASGPTFGDSDAGFGMDDPTGSSNFGFAMPFADNETTTDVTDLDEGDGQPAIEALSDSIPQDGAPGAGESPYSGPGSPFEMADLTPAPFTAETVFGGPVDEAETAGEDELESDAGEPDVAAADSWSDDATSAKDVAPSFSDAPAEDDQDDTPEPGPARATVDDLVASVLRADAAESAVATETADGEGEPDRDGDGSDEAPDLEWSPETVDGGGLADLSQESPGSDFDIHDEEPQYGSLAIEDEPSFDDGVEEQGQIAAGWEEDTPPTEDDDVEWQGDAADGVEAEFQGDVGFGAGEFADVADQPAESVEAEPEWTSSEEGAGEPSVEDMDDTGGDSADEWNEAHTDEILVEEPAEEESQLDAAVEMEAVDDLEAHEEAHFTSGPFSFGDGDPFGSDPDEQATPVRSVVEPQVSVIAPVEVGQSLVRPGDNQLHLRLQGTGAIAESGQVRALDIEVPVPGSWVGNRRVTLQLRLTLSPVPEDDDGGQGDAP